MAVRFLTLAMACLAVCGCDKKDDAPKLGLQPAIESEPEASHQAERNALVHAREGEDEDEHPGKQKRIHALIELLASKNPAPKERMGNLSEPQEYDRTAQVIVYLAIQQLMADGADAFDTLATYFDDKRYSFSYRGVDGEGNMTVGAACHWIMKQTVECYASEISWLTGDQDAIYLYRNSEPDSDLTEWWTASRKRPLWELQVEAIDHAIRFMQTLDRKTARRPYLNVGLAAPEEFESLRKQNLKILEKMKASIEIMREPFRPKMLHLQRAWMGLLPWPTKNPGA